MTTDAKEIKITYTNEQGFECNATLTEPFSIHHCWYSSKRDSTTGKYTKHEVTVFKSFMTHLKKRGCTNINIQGNY